MRDSGEMMQSRIVDLDCVIRPDGRCSTCGQEEVGIRCIHCFTCVCRPCFMQGILHNNSMLFACTGCRRVSDLPGIVASLVQDRHFHFQDYDESILVAMTDLGVVKTRLTILSFDGEKCTAIRVAQATCDRSGDLQIATSEVDATREMFKTLGTVFLVGEKPTYSESGELVDGGDLAGGRAFGIDIRGVCELDGMFGVMQLLALNLRSARSASVL